MDGGAHSTTPGYYDDCARLARYLIDRIRPQWPEKDLSGDSTAITDYRDRLNAAVDSVLEEYKDEAERRNRRATRDPWTTRWSLHWAQLPGLLLPGALTADPAQIRQLITDQTERVLAWARTDPAIVDATVSVVRIRGQFLAVVDGADGTWQCSPAFAQRGAGVAAGISGVQAITREHLNRAAPIWVAAGGERDLFIAVPPEAVTLDAYQTDRPE